MRSITRLIYIIVTGSTLCLLNLQAQAPSDALRNMTQGPNGTARAQAMGGKVGALGADPTATLTNPAGSALYLNNTLSLSLGADFDAYYPYYDKRQGTSAGNYRRANLSNFYYVSSAIGDYLQNPDWAVNWSIQYNRDYDYKRSYSITYDKPTSTVADYIASRANAAGRPLKDYLFVEGKYDPIMTPGLDPAVTMGINGGLVEHNGSIFWPSSWVWPGKAGEGDGVQILPYASNIQVDEAGGRHSIDFNFSTSYQYKLFLGGSLRIGNSHFTRASRYSEAFAYDPKEIKIDFTYDNNLSVTGRSVTASLGAMYALGDYGRIGVSYLLPQYATYNEVYHYEAGSFNNSFKPGEQHVGYNTGDDLTNSYNMWLPGTLTVSAAGILGKYGMITYDFTWTPLASASLRTNGEESVAMVGPNDLIKEYYGNQFSHHLGVEIRPLSWLSVRGGGSYMSSGIELESKDVKLTTEYIPSGAILDFAIPRGTYTGSCGLGFRFKSISWDFAYVFTRMKNEVYPYPSLPSGVNPLLTEGANMDIDRHSFLTTFALSF